MRIQLIHTSGPLKGQIQAFSEPKITIGRDKECEVKFPDDYEVVSIVHATIYWMGTRIKLIVYEKSLTLVNGKTIKECFLSEGDVITLGRNGPKLCFIIDHTEDVLNSKIKDTEIENTIILPPNQDSIVMPCPAPSPKPSSAPQKDVSSTNFEELLEKTFGGPPGKKSNLEMANLSSTISDELNNLSLGQILFNPPKEMKVGRSERIEVRIIQNLKTDLFENLKGRGIPEVSIEKVAPFMKVKLSGDCFDINALHEEGQIVSEGGYTEWAWDVLPLKSGSKKLHLLISVRIKLSFGEEKKDFPIIDKDVKVNVNPIYSTKHFISNNWRWLATALILPILGWAIKTIMK